MQTCECDKISKVQPEMESWYNSVTEWPYVNHDPGQCKCTNELQLYNRNGKQVWLCSCCNLFTDKRLLKQETVKGA